MGIHSRDYYRASSAAGGGWGWDGQTPVVKFLLLANVAVDPPTVPVLHNVNASIAPTPDAIRAALAAQAASPVRWVETIRVLAAQGVTHIIECGPGKVLTGLTKRIVPNVVALPLHDGEAIAAAIAATA